MLIHQFIQIAQQEILPPGVGELPAQQVKINFADVKLPGRYSLLIRLFHMDVLVDDAVDLHHQVGIVRVFSLLLQALVDDENCVFPGAHGIVHIVTVCVAEQPRQFRRIGLEGFLGFQRLAHCVDCILYKAHLFKVLCIHQFLQPEPVFCQKAVRFSDDRADTLNQFRFVHRWVNARRAVLADRIICQSLAQRLYDTNIVHD